MTENAFDEVSLTSSHFLLLQRFTVLLYDKTSNLESVNEARLDLFCKKSRSLENLPPTQVCIIAICMIIVLWLLFYFFKDALLQHVRRACYQSSIWISSHRSIQNVPTPDKWGWVDDDTHCGWMPVWMTIPEAAKACSELIKCGCKSSGGCTSCKCIKAGLCCTSLCSCRCEI